jgi:hypothetical protein
MPWSSLQHFTRMTRSGGMCMLSSDIGEISSTSIKLLIHSHEQWREVSAQQRRHAAGFSDRRGQDCTPSRVSDLGSSSESSTETASPQRSTSLGQGGGHDAAGVREVCGSEELGRRRSDGVARSCLACR